MTSRTAKLVPTDFRTPHSVLPSSLAILAGPVARGIPRAACLLDDPLELGRR
jgi:hypothetical protein